jgi:hypothetical protein
MAMIKKHQNHVVRHANGSAELLRAFPSYSSGEWQRMLTEANGEPKDMALLDRVCNTGSTVPVANIYSALLEYGPTRSLPHTIVSVDAGHIERMLMRPTDQEPWMESFATLGYMSTLVLMTVTLVHHGSHLQWMQATSETNVCLFWTHVVEAITTEKTVLRRIDAITRLLHGPAIRILDTCCIRELYDIAQSSKTHSSKGQATGAPGDDTAHTSSSLVVASSSSSSSSSSSTSSASSLFVHLGPDDQLFHGSKKLYRIQRYIQRHRHLLDPYLKRLHSPLETILDAESPLYEQAMKCLVGIDSEHVHKMPNGYRGDFDEHVVLLYSLVELDKAFPSVSPRPLFRISSLIRDIWKRRLIKDPNFIMYQDTMHLLFHFLDELEACRGIKEVDANGYLHVEYYSVMKQPIVFLGHRATALRYGTGGDECIYGYTFTQPSSARFVDLDHPDALRRLHAPVRDQSPGIHADGPFFSTTPYVEHDVLRFAQMTLHELRAYIFARVTQSEIAPVPEKYYEGNLFKWLQDDIVRYDDDQTTDDDGNPLPASYFALPLQLSDDVYKTLLHDECQRYHTEHHEEWKDVCRAFALDSTLPAEVCNQAIVKYIMDRVPVMNAKTNWEIAYIVRTKVNARYEQDCINQNMHNRFLPSLLQLSAIFRAKGTAVQDMIVTLQNNAEVVMITTTDDPLFKRSRVKIKVDLVEKWTEYFEIDLASPRGVWYCAVWDRIRPGGNISAGRYSNYEVDALLVYSFTTSKWLEQTGAIGWRCASVEEWMVYQPSKLGSMRKVIEKFDDLESDEFDMYTT